LVIRDWGKGGATVRLNQAPIEAGENFAIGHRDRMEGTDLIVWIRTSSTTPVQIELTPAGE